MKILQVNCVYNVGSTGKIVYDIHSELLRQGHESLVCYGRGVPVDAPNVIQTSREWYSKLSSLRAKLTGVMYGGAYFSTRYLERVILREKPDVVHLQCINGFFVNIYQLVSFLKTHQIKTLLTLHAEFMHTANCGYSFDCDRWLTGCGKCPQLKEVGSWFVDNTALSWRKMKQAFDGFDQGLMVASVSPWLMERAKRSPILKGKQHVTVYNGLNTEVFHYYQKEEERQALGLPMDRTIVFHASPNFDDNPDNIKGGYYVIELAKRMPEVLFVIAAPYPSQLAVPDNLKLLGSIRDQSLLARYYAAADLTVLASKKETFSMVCAESLCCGTPIVGFQAGAPEMISLPAYSSFVTYADVEALQREAIRMLAQPNRKEQIAAEALPVYSKQRMTEEYIRLYRKLMGE